MHVKALDVTIYEHDGWTHYSQTILDPTWDEIELAIRRLDKDHYPFVILWPTEDEAQHELVEGSESFEIVGGKGDYWFAASIGGYFQRRYINPRGSDKEKEIELWTSDQGFSDLEWYWFGPALSTRPVPLGPDKSH